MPISLFEIISTLNMSYQNEVDMVCSTHEVKSLCFNWTPCHEGIFGEWRYSSMHS